MSRLTWPHVLIVGVHFRGSDVKALVATLTPGQTLRLEREPTNPHDSGAICAFFEDVFIGYVERSSAAWISPHMDAGHLPTEVVVRDLSEDARRNPVPVVSITLEEEPTGPTREVPGFADTIYSDDDIPF